MLSEQQCRVLLVEDSRGDAMLTQALLAEAGAARAPASMSITSQLCRYAAATRSGRRTYDVMLLDLGLPDSEGVAPVAQLCDRYPSLAIVVMTALEDTDVAIDASRAARRNSCPRQGAAG